MRQRGGEGIARQPARVLRLPAKGAAARVMTMTWRSVGGAAMPATITAAPDASNGAELPFAQPGTEIERWVEAARQQGRAEGEALGAQRAGQRVESAIADLGALARDLAQQRARLRQELEEDTVKLALVIARRVLHRELATDPEAVLGLVKAAFQKLNIRETHRLRVSPLDAAVLEEHRASLNLPPGLEVVRDASLPKGSVLFETSRGELDASIDTQLAEIERGLTDIVRRRAT